MGFSGCLGWERFWGMLGWAEEERFGLIFFGGVGGFVFVVVVGLMDR